MMWNLSFITEQDFTDHVKATIENYGEKLESFDLKRFNKNIIDPIKLIFDKTVYQSSWDEIVSNEIFRQRDKSNNNDIGYFHQRIFQYIKNCHVPPNGEEGGWDVIYENDDGIPIPDAGNVHTVYVEMKNKHNTMNSASAGKTFIKMQNQLLNDDDCACFLVEAIAQRSQNIKWETTVDKKKVGHKLIRRVSIDQFYALVTGQDDAFYQMCMVLPSVIEKAVKELEGTIVPHDTVIDELKSMASKQNIESEDLAIAMAAYMLGFGCHYILDSTCHPYVNQVAKEGKISHTLLEKEFDRMLMYETGKNPLHFYPSHGIRANFFSAWTIHQVLPAIRTWNIYLSLKMMKIFTCILVCDDGGRKKRLSEHALSPAGKKRAAFITEFFMSPEPEVDCRKELLKLDSLMEEALEKAPDMLEELSALAVRPGHLSERWNLTFNG